ncbi:chlororespiratory reduction 42 [Carex littledalei]|uniref:Chlororespiratory reduction 42 n=1 Tax=Carex littledalei TaxID=544730 RepID=A0A833QD57_9POAL|nr:chlororespiratory reduction 42 [Carex littledalei]
MLSSASADTHTAIGFCDQLRIKFRAECRFTNCYNRAPPALKTATPMPSLRANTGQVKAGDVGRVVARKPKDVWAVRLAIGTYLLDAKYFRPFDEEE